MTVIAERSLVADLVAMWAGDPLHRMSVRLDLTARQARRDVERALDRFEPDFIIDNWGEVAPFIVAAFLDAQLGALDIAMEYLEAVAGSAVAVPPAPYLGVIGTVDVETWLESKDNPDAADKTAAAAARRENVAEVAETEPLVVGRDAVATTANNDMRFTHYARVPNPGACDWCRMLASRGAVYTADTVVKTRDGQPYHMRQARTRKDGTTYYPGGPCRCTFIAVPAGADPTAVPDVARKVTTRQMAAARSLYREGARTSERAASVDRQISILRAQQSAGRGNEWTAARLAELEAEQVDLAMPRSLLGVARDLAYRYNPQQPRDEAGRWTSGGGGATLAAKQAAAAAIEEAAWAQVKTNNREAANLKRTAAAGVAARMADVPAADMAAAARAVDDTDTLGFGVAMDEIDAAVEAGDTVQLARDLDGYYYARYPDLEKPIAGWEHATHGTPEYDAMVREGAVAGFIDKWSQTSNDHDDGSLAIQESIRREFGIAEAANWTSSGGDPTTILREHGPVLQNYARAMYDNTQADLAARGITEVTVYRGTGIPLGDEPNYLTGTGRTTVLRPASSWSTDRDVAWEFGAIAQDQGTATAILTTTVPASRVLSTPNSGAGCLSEAEVILLGGTLDVDVERL